MAQRIWDNVLTDLEKKINKQSFGMWLKDTEPLSIKGDTLQIKVKDDVAVRHLKDKYLKDIEEIIESTTGKKYSCEFITEIEFKDMEKTIQTETFTDKQQYSKTENNRISPLNENYTFENFVVGPNNQLAHAAAKSVSRSPATQFNPLFIYGGTGLGKTHLIQAIGHYILQERPYLKVLYIPTEQFINEFIYAIQTNTTHSFKIKYRNVDILMIDDIQFLEKKEETQNEFFHTFNTLYENKKQIIISSDRPPKQIATLADRLRTRFEWGMITDIQTPNLETREAILRNKAAKENIVISDEAFNYIARRITSSIRALESALANLRMVYDIYNEPITMKHIKEHLKHLFDEESSRKVTPNDIITKISDIYSISVEDIISKSRQSKIVTPRFVAMYLTRKLTDMTTTDIGKQFGHRDHSTVVNAINKIEEDMKNDADFKEHIEELKVELRS
ncbi:MAG TPA: chromosomal replication initiator protein DnaA [Spirochaetota bacterium]|nr:chromosomal replication initiator protein DnaA [Spirochaetota bacterium]HPS85800.1 chromosomal replication initiator protein DnaA [Spirochaetota bacterium]